MSSRRIGTQSSATRAALVEAAAKVMREKGYAAVTAREVSLTAGLKPQLVHYYFRKMDDLLLAVLRFAMEERMTQLAEAVFSEQPLRALWELNRHAKSTPLELEFGALSNHDPTIREEVRRFAEKIRGIQMEALTRYLDSRNLRDVVPPGVLTILIAGLSAVLVREEAMGMSGGHAETEAFIETWLDRLSGASKKSARAGGARRAQKRKA